METENEKGIMGFFFIFFCLFKYMRNWKRGGNS